MKRILILGIVLSLIFSSFSFKVTFAQENEAEAILGSSVKSSGFKLLETGASKTPSVAIKGGVECWVLDKQNGTAQAYINIALADKVKNDNSDGSVYEVEVSYYDEGNGFFNLFYDGLSYDKQLADTVYLKGTKSWKTAVFTLDDTKFQEKLDGKYDIQLSITESSVTSAVSVPISRIKVTRHKGVNPIWVTSVSDRTGNAFEWFSDKKIIHNKLENLTDKQLNVTITHSLVSNEEYNAYEKTESLSFAPNEVKELDFDFTELERCDVYNYYINIKSDDGTINSELLNMKLAILKTDPDGIVDDRISYNAHFTHTTSVDAHKAMWDILKLSNAEGIRENAQWDYLEKQKGVLAWDDVNKMAWSGLAENGFKAGMVLFQCSPTFYSGGRTLPMTDEELEAWRNYISFAAEHLKGYTDRYEIWNEPNIEWFNRLYQQRGGETYTKAFEIAAEEIKEIEPEAKVGGPSLTGIQYDSGYSYWRDALEAGFWKTADAIVLHPYTTDSFEKTGQIDVIRKYKKEFMEAGGKEPEMWHTEIGFTKADDFVVTDRMQGALNARIAILLYSNKLADKISYYNLERKGTVKTDREHMFGMVSPKGTQNTKLGKRCIPTEAYVELVAMCYMLAKSEIKSVHNSEDGNLYISRFTSEKFGKDVVTLHTSEEAEVVTMNLGTDMVTLFDEYGNSTEVYGNNGIFTFTANNYPNYILGDITKLEVLENNIISYDKAEVNAAEGDTFPISVFNNTDKEYSVEVDAPQNIKIISNDGFKDGKATVMLENLCEKDKSTFVLIKIKDGDKIVHTGKIIIVSSDMMTSEFSVSLDDTKDTSKWTGTLKIKNNSATSALTGTLDFTSADVFSQLKDINIGIIPPGRTGSVVFSLPKITRKGQYFPKYEIITDKSGRHSFLDSVEFTLGKYADKKPTIDGVISDGEWSMDTAMYADNAEQLRQIPDWGGADDLSGKSAVMWDDNNFYMCAVVTDDKHVNTRSANENWNGDNIQFGIYFGGNGFTAIGQSGTSFHEISLALNSLTGKTTTYRYMSQDNVYPAGELTDAECVVKREGDKTIYEFMMPWDSLLRPGDKPQEGDMLGYSFLFNESDTELRQGWIEYASGIGMAKDVSLFTYMTLIK